mgnify:CR=1 FL=1
MKVKIVNNGMNTRDCKVFIDDHDMTRNLTEIDVKIKGGEIPTLKLAFYPDDIEIEGDYEVFKKIPEEKKKETTSFSIGDIKAEPGTEEFAKEISNYLEEILKPFK